MNVNRKILLVEDDYKYRHSIVHSFEGEYAFLEAASVTEGLRLTLEHPDVQVVILDLALQGSTGTDFLEGIKERISDYRVIVLTAHDELLGAEQAKSYEVFSYVAKADTSRLRESLRFQVERAFEDIEKAWLRKKINAHLEIDRMIVSSGREEEGDADQKLRDILSLICRHALGLTDGYTCHIRLFDPGKGDFVLQASEGNKGSAESLFIERVRHSEAYSGIVAETRRPLRVDDLQNDPPFVGMREAALAAGGVEPRYRRYLDTARSAYVVPISTGLFGDDIDAVFNINSDIESFFLPDAKREVVTDFVTQTALAITKHLLRKKRFEIHSDYKNISDMLEEVSDVLKGEVDLAEIYRIVFKRVSAGLKPELISIFLLDDTSGLLRNVAEFPPDARPHAVGVALRPGEGVVGRVFDTGDPARRVLADDPQDVDADLAARLAQEDLRDIPSGLLRHYLCVPIKVGENRIGCIRAVNKKSELYGSAETPKGVWLLKRGFSDDCQLELVIAASHLAAAIKNAELFGQLSKRMSQFEAIHTVGERISSRMSMGAVLELIVSEAARVVHAEICMLFMKNEKGDRLVLRQSFGMPPIPGADYGIGEGLTGKLADPDEEIAKKGFVLEKKVHGTRRGKYDDEIEEFLRSRHGRLGAPSSDIESFMAVKIVGKGRILGVIKVINKVEPPYQFDEDDVKLFQVFASQIGLETFLDIQNVLNVIVKNSPDPIIILDDRGIIVFFNNACEELWGYKSEEAIGQSVIDFYESEAQARSIGRQLRESEGNQIRNVEAKIKTKGGEIITVSLSASLFFDEAGEKVGSMGVFKDLREIDRLRYQMLQTEKEAAIGKLAQTLSHDIKTNIATALNYIDVLRYESVKDQQDELFDIYTDAEKALWNATDKIQNLILAVQPKSPQKHLLLVSEIFRDVLGPMSRQAEIKNIDFSLDYSEDGRRLLLDIEQFQQALWNLFNNSLKAIDSRRAGGEGPERGRISILARLEDDVLELTWEDNGCGIPAENVPKLFQPFFTTSQRGSGLGLHGVKNVVEGHDGDITVESTVGAGTRFKLTLPVTAGQSPEARG